MQPVHSSSLQRGANGPLHRSALLLDDDLDASIRRTTFRRVVVRNWIVLAVAHDLNARGIDPRFDQVVRDGLRALLCELFILLRRAPTAPNETLRPMVQDCVFQDAEIKENVTPDCLACTIMAAECAADMCVAECLAGDSALCDSCRKMNNCDQPVFECGGIPSPL